MKEKREKRVPVTLNASEDEVKMIEFIMKKDSRFTRSDCVRNLIYERYFFLKKNMQSGINDSSDQRA